MPRGSRIIQAARCDEVAFPMRTGGHSRAGWSQLDRPHRIAKQHRASWRPDACASRDGRTPDVRTHPCGRSSLWFFAAVAGRKTDCGCKADISACRPVSIDAPTHENGKVNCFRLPLSHIAGSLIYSDTFRPHFIPELLESGQEQGRAVRSPIYPSSLGGVRCPAGFSGQCPTNQKFRFAPIFPYFQGDSASGDKFPR